MSWVVGKGKGRYPSIRSEREWLSFSCMRSSPLVSRMMRPNMQMLEENYSYFIPLARVPRAPSVILSLDQLSHLMVIEERLWLACKN